MRRVHYRGQQSLFPVWHITDGERVLAHIWLPIIKSTLRNAKPLCSS